jgi:hypothetical protein
MRNPHNSRETQQGFLIDFIPAEKIRVITEISQEPAKPPQGLRCAIKTARDGLAGMLFGFEDAEAQTEERLLRMPAVRSPLDPNEEQAFERIVPIGCFEMQARKMALHE